MSIYISRDSSMSTLAPDLINRDPEDMSNEELERGIDLLEASNKYLAIENGVIESYLRTMEPDLLSGMETAASTPGRSQAPTYAIQSAMMLMTPRMSLTAPVPPEAGSVLTAAGSAVPAGSRRSSMSVRSHLGSVLSYRPQPPAAIAPSPIILEKGPRINMSNKEDIASRETDELKAALEKLHKTSTSQRANIKAKLQETEITLQEIREANANLEQVEQGVDPITGRIPAEKFVRHLEEWLKKADSMVEKMRLRTSTLRAQNIRLQQLLEQKEELGENLHPVDFEQLQIQNKKYLEKIEQKNRHLLQMKQMTGRCNLLLTVQKKKMQDQTAELTGMQDELKALEERGKNFEEAADVVDAEADAAEEKCKTMRNMIANYTAPDVLDYIKKIAEVYDLQHAVKVWSRRKKIQQTALTACKRVLLNLQQTSRCGRIGTRSSLEDGAMSEDWEEGQRQTKNF